MFAIPSVYLSHRSVGKAQKCLEEILTNQKPQRVPGVLSCVSGCGVLNIPITDCAEDTDDVPKNDRT